jgi:hypothetical protein
MVPHPEYTSVASRPSTHGHTGGADLHGTHEARCLLRHLEVDARSTSRELATSTLHHRYLQTPLPFRPPRKLTKSPLHPGPRPAECTELQGTCNLHNPCLGSPHPGSGQQVADNSRDPSPFADQQISLDPQRGLLLPGGPKLQRGFLAHQTYLVPSCTPPLALFTSHLFVLVALSKTAISCLDSCSS